MKRLRKAWWIYLDAAREAISQAAASSKEQPFTSAVRRTGSTHSGSQRKHRAREDSTFMDGTASPWVCRCGRGQCHTPLPGVVLPSAVITSSRGRAEAASMSLLRSEMVPRGARAERSSEREARRTSTAERRIASRSTKPSSASATSAASATSRGNLSCSPRARRAETATNWAIAEPISGKSTRRQRFA